MGLLDWLFSPSSEQSLEDRLADAQKRFAEVSALYAQGVVPYSALRDAESDVALWAGKIQMARISQRNPRTPRVERYNPDEEQFRAVVQGIYESEAVRYQGAKTGIRPKSFLTARGLRTDRSFSLEERKALLRKAFAIAQALRNKKTERTKSRARYVDFQELLQNRNDYELTLALSRWPEGPFFRLTLEPTRAGDKLFVWPLVPKFGPIQVPTDNIEEAKKFLSAMNRDEKLIKKLVRGDTRVLRVTKKDLADWLPPRSRK